MGMAAMGRDAVKGVTPESDAGGFQKEMQRRMTYEPRTPMGKSIAENNPLALVGKGVNRIGEAVGEIAAPPGSGPLRESIGAGIHEGINQLPGLVGGKAPAIAEGAGNAMRAGAERTMQSALKPSITDLKSGAAGKAVDTMLEEGINVSKGGVSKLNEKIDALNLEIADRVKNSPKVVNKYAVAERLQELMDWFKKQVTPMSDMAAIQKAWDEFLDHPSLTNPNMSVETAQSLKQGTYQSLGKKSYGELKGADIEAQKTLARGLKEEIAKAVPEVRPLNAQESKLLNALPMVERRALMEANKNPMGLSLLASNTEKMAAFMAERSAIFKSIIARMLNQGSKAVKETGPLGVPTGIATTGAAGDEKEQRYREWKRKQGIEDD
jgi:hypothetical protein